MQRPDKKLSSEHKKKISLALMGNRHGVKNLIGRHSEETKAKIRAAKLAKPTRYWLGKRRSETMQRLRAFNLANPTRYWLGKKRGPFPAAWVKNMLMASQVRPNKAELRLGELLELAAPGQWRYVGDGSLIIGGKCPDFVNVDGQKKIVEMFGEHWHPSGDEKRRQAVFAGLGFLTLVVWEKELRRTELLLPKLQAFSTEGNE